MPTYEYKCVNCGYKIEIFQNITDAPLSDCSNCNKGTLKRLIGTGSGIIFKGSGFYQTDYRSSSYQKASKSDAPQGSSPKDNKTSNSEKKKE